MSKFTRAIAHNWPDYVIAPGAAPNRECCGTQDCESIEDVQAFDEGSFSWSECESCGTSLGGHRYPAHAIAKNAFGRPEKPGDIYHIEICADCLMYHANGDEPETWEN